MTARLTPAQAQAVAEAAELPGPLDVTPAGLRDMTGEHDAGMHAVHVKALARALWHVQDLLRVIGELTGEQS